MQLTQNQLFHPMVFSLFLSYVDRKEIEEKTDGRRETIEELLEMKKQLTIDLKRERRMERERLGLI